MAENTTTTRRPGDPIPLHDLLDLEFLDAVEGSPFAEVRMPVQPNAFGFTANLHGGAVATVVDCACALAVARAVAFDPTAESLVTVDMHVRYLGRPRTDAVVARAEIVKLGSTIIVVECKVVDEGGHVVASADFSMMRVALREPLSDAVVGRPGDVDL
ncbi:PaaI family thioesterase [Dermatobacter hominis]|uniref:PaaI family thioesterase n=1 Tax=Dermatobacter hominis TaxID=2884263 RepID=UPI001D0FBC6A|nr:PaaI family thioesterase [Dermatobacter hominis]UDY34978.1 PaaI family thioesterase [Dermatobacter hominis]